MTHNTASASDHKTLTSFIIIEYHDDQSLDHMNEVDYYLKKGYKIVTSGQYQYDVNSGEISTLYWTHLLKEAIK